MSQGIIELKGEMSMLNVLRLSAVDTRQILELLQSKINNAPQFFLDSPLVLDCQELGEACEQIEFAELHSAVSKAGFVPVGVRNIPESCIDHVKHSGWAVMRANKSGKSAEKSVGSSVGSASKGNSVEVISRPLRSGQQVYAPSGDVVVLHQTSAGSEILANGSVHVYGALRGRVLAGINGEKSARIFCQSLEAELVAIAGCYQLLDDAETELKGQSAMIRLEDGRLVFEPLA